MFNQFNVKKTIDIEAELLKNRRESLADISKYLSKISYNLNSFSTVDISISKYIMDKNTKRENNNYKQIKDKMQMILTVNGRKERYILTDTTKKSSKNAGEKTFKAYSFEKTLENKFITFSSSGKSYPLINDGVEDGILEMVAEKSGWKIGYVDELAKSEYINMPVTKTTKIKKNLICLKVQPDQLLWEADVNITTDVKDIPLNITIEHKDLSRYDSYGDQLTSNETIQTVLDPVHTDVTNIKAYYYSVAGNRYGIKLLLKLKDGAIITQVKEFTNIQDLQMKCSEVNIICETGNLEKQYTTKYVWLENVDSSIYNFLTDMQDQFNVIFMYDTYNNIINCYSKDNLKDESPLLLSFDTNVIDVSVKQSENPISGVRVSGKDDVSIIDVNKYGSDIIYNYNYFIINDLLSEELMETLIKYEKYLDDKQIEWNNLSENRRLLYENKVKLDCEIKSLTERITTLAELLSAFISANSSTSEQERIKKEKVELEKLFNANIKLRNKVNEEIDNIDASMSNIIIATKRENCGIFTNDDLQELNDIEIIETYSNDVATTSDGLYNSASWYLNERTKPTVEFSINCGNLIKLINNPLGWNEILQLTKLVYLDAELSSEIGESQVRLVGMDIDVKNKSIGNLSFTNKIFPVDLLSKAKNMQKKAVTMLLNNNTYKSVWKDSTSVNNFVNDFKNNGVNVGVVPIRTNSLYSIAADSEDNSNVKMMSRGVFGINTVNMLSETSYENDNDVEQSSAGIFIRSKSNPDKQLYIGSGIFAISSNGFETSEVAIDDNGITAKLLKGKILLGEKLYITSDDGNETFYIGNMEENNGFGLCIKDEITGQTRIFLGTELDENGIKKAKLKLIGKNGEVAITEDGLVNTYCFPYNDELDKDHPLVFKYPIDEGTFEVRECKISISLQKYRMTVKSLSSGGTVSTTSEGGAVISTTGNGGFYSNTYSSAESVDFGYNTYTSAQSENENGTHVHEYVYGVAKHSHLVTVHIEDHYHTINIDPHNHEINTEHNHDLEAGIFEATLPSNCSLYINDVLVASEINNDSSFDVKDYLEIGKDNTVKITSDTLGRIQLSILNKSFVTN